MKNTSEKTSQTFGVEGRVEGPRERSKGWCSIHLNTDWVGGVARPPLGMYVGGLGGKKKNGLESEYAAVNLPESSRKLWRDESSKRCRCSELEELPRENEDRRQKRL